MAVLYDNEEVSNISFVMYKCKLPIVKSFQLKLFTLALKQLTTLIQRVQTLYVHVMTVIWQFTQTHLSPNATTYTPTLRRLIRVDCLFVRLVLEVLRVHFLTGQN